LALYCPAILKGEEDKPHILERECVACGICAQICPVEAIHPFDEIGAPQQEGVPENFSPPLSAF
jgi:formate hydrogenlyase subunit 6/NADH:ubiquinone oxidoreductase subunit I